MTTQTTERHIQRDFKVGDLVLVDSKYTGEIIEDRIGDGSFYRVEVDTDMPNHEFWTVSSKRMELQP